MLIEVDAFASNETADSPFDEAYSDAWDIIDAHPRSWRLRMAQHVALSLASSAHPVRRRVWFRKANAAA